MKYGVFGIGRIGRVHADILRSQEQEIVAIGDENADCIKDALQSLGLDVPTFTSAEAMAKSGLLEAAVVCSHTKDHARDAGPFIAHGIPTYCEKPLTAELAEAFDFCETSGATPSTLQIGLQRRFDDALVYAKKLIDDGVIGELREIRSALRDQSPPPPYYVSPGLIADMGIHVADEVCWLCGEHPATVWAHLLETANCPDSRDDGGHTAFVGFTMPSGVVGRLDLSRTHASGYLNETYVMGSKGTMHVGRFCGYPGPIPVEVYGMDGKLMECSKTFEMDPVNGPASKAEFLPRFYAAYYNAHLSFREALKEKKPFVVSQRAALDAQVFVEAAQRSASQDGALIKLQRSEDVSQYRKDCLKLGILKN